MRLLSVYSQRSINRTSIITHTMSMVVESITLTSNKSIIFRNPAPGPAAHGTPARRTRRPPRHKPPNRHPRPRSGPSHGASTPAAWRPGHCGPAEGRPGQGRPAARAACGEHRAGRWIASRSSALCSFPPPPPPGRLPGVTGVRLDQAQRARLGQPAHDPVRLARQPRGEGRVVAGHCPSVVLLSHPFDHQAVVSMDDEDLPVEWLGVQAAVLILALPGDFILCTGRCF